MNYCSNLRSIINTLLILNCVFLSIACNTKKKDGDDKMSQVYVQLKSFPLKLEGEGIKI